MKKLSLIFLAAFIVHMLNAQSPGLFKYQSVVRTSTGELLSNQLVAFRISILQSSATGSSVYTETHSVVTTGQGFANLSVGDGTVISGDFASIDWAAGPYFLRIEMDPAGGSSYALMGTSQLLSVPYALHAESATHVDDNDWVVSEGKMYPYWTVNVGINNSNPQDELDVYGTLRAYNDWSEDPCAVFDGRTRFMDRIGVMESNPQFDLDLLGTFRAKQYSGSPEPCALFEGKTQFWDKIGVMESNPQFDLDVFGTFRARQPFGSAEACAIFEGRTDFEGKVGVMEPNPQFELDVYGSFRARQANGSTEACATFQGRTLFEGKIGVANINPEYDLDVNGTFYAHQPIGSTEPCALFFGYTNFSGPVGIGNNDPQAELDISGRMIVTEDAGAVNPCALFDGRVKVTNKIGLGMDPSNDDLMAMGSSGDAWLSIHRNGGSLTGVKFYKEGTTKAQWIFPFIRGWDNNNAIIRDDVALLDVMTFEYGTGRVGIGTDEMGTYKLSVNGTAYSTGGWTGSDRRLKKDILPINSALDKILKIEGVTYDFDNSDYPDKDLPEGRHYGVIAQQLEKVCPEMVQDGPDGLKAVAYDQLIPLLIEAVKEQQEQIDRLVRENREMRIRFSGNGL